MDLFGKRRIQDLEEQLRRKDREISSLKSDLEIVERQNHALKSKYEPNRAPGTVKTSSGLFQQPGPAYPSSEGAAADTPPRSPSGRTSDNSGDMLVGAMLGAAVGFALSSDGAADCSRVPGTDVGGIDNSDSSSGCE